MDELCGAAQATGTRFVPLPAFNYKGAFNLYLPIFFVRGVRMEIEARDEIAEFYAQIDYRTENHAKPAPLLVSSIGRSGLRLKYLGQMPARTSPPSASLRHTIERSETRDYGVRGEWEEFTLRGAGILRELSFRGDTLSDLELRMYWDNHTDADVDAPLAYFFADFVNTAVESRAGQSTCYFPMPIRKQPRIAIRSRSGHSGRVRSVTGSNRARCPSKRHTFALSITRRRRQWAIRSTQCSRFEAKAYSWALTYSTADIIMAEEMQRSLMPALQLHASCTGFAARTILLLRGTAPE